jgi:hypothetical protein
MRILTEQVYKINQSFEQNEWDADERGWGWMRADRTEMGHLIRSAP